MKKSDLCKNHNSFDSAIARYRAFIEKILNAQRVINSNLEKKDIAESVLLRLCANWESFIDEHLVDCVNVDHTMLSEYFAVSLPRNPSKPLCQALIFGNSYKDFKSFGDLKGFTKKILPEASNPFLAVSRSDSEKIDEVYKIRNYLSHYSFAAKRSLKKMYADKYDMQRFIEPGQFLLAYDSRRLKSYFSAFEDASKDMRSCY